MLKMKEDKMIQVEEKMLDILKNRKLKIYLFFFLFLMITIPIVRYFKIDVLLSLFIWSLFFYVSFKCCLIYKKLCDNIHFENEIIEQKPIKYFIILFTIFNHKNNYKKLIPVFMILLLIYIFYNLTIKS